jgi:hypothetical protein
MTRREKLLAMGETAYMAASRKELAEIAGSYSKDGSLHVNGIGNVVAEIAEKDGWKHPSIRGEQSAVSVKALGGVSGRLRSAIGDCSIAFPTFFSGLSLSDITINVGNAEQPKIIINRAFIEAMQRLQKQAGPTFAVICKSLHDSDWTDLGIETDAMRSSRLAEETRQRNALNSAIELLRANGFTCERKVSDTLDFTALAPVPPHNEVELLLYPFHYVANREKARREAGKRRTVAKLERAEKARKAADIAAIPEIVAVGFTPQQEALIAGYIAAIDCDRETAIAALKAKGKIG